MATFEHVTVVSCTVEITAGVPGALVDRFVVRETSTPLPDEMITFVPPAAGGYPDGVLAMRADIPQGGSSPYSGMAITSYVPAMNGGEFIVELGEICTQGALLRVGGNSTEVDGAAYLANATNDIAVAKACEGGVVGQKIRCQWVMPRVVP